MRVSGFTIVRNAVKFKYPVVESVRSILPICDEFIVNVGKSEDATIELIRGIGSPKIKIIETVWDMGQGPAVLSQQTNAALGQCSGDWAFYLQSDEVIHEADLPKLQACMHRHLHDDSIDALRFKWLHFYGSFWRYRIDAGWYQKQDRIIRNNGAVESFGDAFGFRRKDGTPLRSANTGCLLYHYGWVNSLEDMGRRSGNAAQIGYGDKGKDLTSGYGDLNRFPVYYGAHPAVMKGIISRNALTAADGKEIQRRYWWNPLYWLKPRLKTGRRVKERVT